MLNKTTLSGGFDTMQYYATVSEEGADLDNIMQLLFYVSLRLRVFSPRLGLPVWAEQETSDNAFTFVHHNLNASTNSHQYSMLLDIANNLLVYTKPRRKKKIDRYLFMLEMDNID